MFGYPFRSGRFRPVFFWPTILVGATLALASTTFARGEFTSPGPRDATSAAKASATTELPRTALMVGSRRITVEIAADPASQSRGLMFRERLPADHGMLFVFPSAEQRCFWMKNTPLPLTIAYIDTEGRIVSLADMQPYSLEPHCSIAPARYALEMEQGWFARHGFGPGTRITEAQR